MTIYFKEESIDLCLLSISTSIMRSSSLYWTILGFFYALFVQWSIFLTIKKPSLLNAQNEQPAFGSHFQSLTNKLFSLFGWDSQNFTFTDLTSSSVSWKKCKSKTTKM